ncbi:hypothetical protein IAE33_003148 [Pseudomonas sp. S60]|uniref:hypothetical protein n=1 Tax=Pseudomonas sp. S60 TaxID=211124 RepID=UPI00191269FB|nr:hypothetical protein [Pseudomonas sp. S60]MBK5011288.1 hypothetical protein [Pseudomonas sp. S60]
MARESLEQFIAYLSQAPRTLGWDAILAYDRNKANRLLIQEYIQRFSKNSYFEPLTFTTEITPGQRWEITYDYVLDKPRLSFEHASISSSRADLSMRIVGGRQLSVSKALGDSHPKITRLKMADALNGATLHVRIELEKSAGSVTDAGAVQIDMTKGTQFYLTFADTDEENRLGGERFKKIFEAWPEEKQHFELNRLAVNPGDFLQPETFLIRTHAAPASDTVAATVKEAAEQAADGAVLAFIKMKNGKSGTLPPSDEDMHYLLPDDFSMNILLSGRYFFEELVKQWCRLVNAEEPTQPVQVTFRGGENGAHYTGMEANSGLIILPEFSGKTENTNNIIVHEQGLRFVSDASDKQTSFEVYRKKLDGDAHHAITGWWSGITDTWISVEGKSGNILGVPIRPFWSVHLRYELDVTGGHLQFRKVYDSRQFEIGEGWELLIRDRELGPHQEEIKEFIRAYVLGVVGGVIEKLKVVGDNIDAFRLNGLLFQGGKQTASPSAADIPGDMTLPGHLAPSVTGFQINPIEKIISAGSTFTFTCDPANLRPSWSVSNVAGETGDVGSINETTGMYTAPSASTMASIQHKRVIVTARTEAGNSSQALIHLVTRQIGIDPLVMAVSTGKVDYKITAAALGGQVLTWKLSEGAKGELKDFYSTDPDLTCKVYVSPPASSASIRIFDEQRGLEVAQISDAWLEHRASGFWTASEDLAQVLGHEQILLSAPGLEDQVIDVLVPLEPETNWFTYEEKGTAIQLTHWTRDKKGERLVDPDDNQWFLVTGDGTFEDGLYTPPASGGAPYAVVAAIEENDRGWYWTYAILPFPFFQPKVTQASEVLVSTQGEVQS